jgi:hypothetical protein
MEKDFKELLKITEEEKSEIKKNSPASLPLNPTAQGWSGSEIRKKLSHSIIGEKGSILALLNKRLITLGEYFNDINAGGGGGDRTYVGPDEPSSNFFTKWIKTTGDEVDVEIEENSTEADFEEIETEPMLDEIESGELKGDEMETEPMLDEIESGELTGDEIITPPQFE